MAIRWSTVVIVWTLAQGIVTLSFFFAVVKGQFARYPARSRRFWAGLLALYCAGYAFILVAHQSDIPEILQAGGLIATGVGLAAAFIVGSPRTVFLRPVEWEHIGMFRWCEKFDGLEFIWSGIGGPRERTWHEDAIRLINNSTDGVTLERIELQTSSGIYPANLARKQGDGGMRIEPGTEGEVKAMWWFDRPLGEICSNRARVVLWVLTGAERRELQVDLQPA